MGNLNRKISVIMATYNGERYLREQLDSIINQSQWIDELIIVDDCSVDSTCRIIEEYQQRYPIIRLIRNKQNLGVVKTFEKALLNSSGDYIVFSDQDDVWFENKIAVLMDSIGDNLLVYSDTIVVDEKLNKLYDSNLKFFETARNFSCFRDYLFGNNVTGCTMMIHRKLFDEVASFPVLRIIFHDQFLALCASYKGKLKKVTTPLMLYRQHSKNLSASYNRLGYQKILNNFSLMAMDLFILANLPIFNSGKDVTNDYKFVIDFFKAMAHEKYPSISLILFCKREFSLRMFFWFIRMACLSKFFGQLNYNLAPLKTKIKKWVAQ